MRHALTGLAGLLVLTGCTTGYYYEASTGLRVDQVDRATFDRFQRIRSICAGEVAAVGRQSTMVGYGDGALAQTQMEGCMAREGYVIRYDSQ